ncbi:MAG: AMP-binding protein [Gammaproteobacteria bacterium]|jgi:fatty-acyl-CoA synthase|nr:AMP-binding protein [Gammaproteobacteria bacterium]MDC0465027.1 AMP-binding protein [Pseudomonadales bacterium]
MPSLAIEMGARDQPLLAQTIGDNLRQTVARVPNNDAIVALHQGLRWSYQEFYARVQRLASGLLAQGLKPLDRLGLWSPNYAEWTLVQYATAEIGVVLVNINPAYRTHELAYALNQSGCRFLIAAPSYLKSNYQEMVSAVQDQTQLLERAIFFWSPEWEVLIAGDAQHQSGVDDLRGQLSPDDPINIQYTSGTTGFPKGATLTHRNILNNGYFVGELQRLTEEDRMCIPVPFYHCFGMVMGNLACTSHGATMVIPSDGFSAEQTLEAVSQERCTALYGVPTMFIAELALENFSNFDLSSLRTGVMAGAPCPVEVMKQCIDRMRLLEVTICYGMTETSPVSTQTLPEDSLAHRTETVGRAHPHVDIRIAHPDTGETLPRGETGEFCTRGYSVMTGYWDDPVKTTEAIDAAGWMHTGDLAVMGLDGYVQIVGRIKDMVIRGGENIYPREIEEFLYTHPEVEEVQVIGVPDRVYGEQLMAWIKRKPDLVSPQLVSQEALKAFCAGKIAHYKVPHYVQFVEDFPMTVTGKIRKVEMRALSIKALGLNP